MLKSIILVFFFLFLTCHCFPSDEIQCFPPATITLAATGAKLTIGCADSTLDYVNFIGYQNVILSGDKSEVTYPFPPNAYNQWDICNCGIGNNANSNFLKADANGGLFFTTSGFLAPPYSGIMQVPDMDITFVISVPTAACPTCVLTANLNDNTVTASPIADNENDLQAQYWNVLPSAD